MTRGSGVAVAGAMVAALSALTLTACSAASTPASPTPTSTGQASPQTPPLVTVSATPSATPKAPDVTASQITSAPAACGIPEHRLVADRGGLGTTETLLQIDEGYGDQPPVPPVAADLTGDGSVDLVGVLSCTKDGNALPDHLVLYRGPAVPVASVDVAAGGAEDLAVVRSLTADGTTVRVQWTAFDASGNHVAQYEGRVLWDGRRLTIADRRRAGGPRAVSVRQGSFFTVDGNVHCQMYPQATWCDVDATSWTPPAPPPEVLAPAASPTPATSQGRVAGCGTRAYGRTIVLAGDKAKVSCMGEAGPEVTAVGAPTTAWFRTGWDPTVTVDGRRSAALAAGSSMTDGRVRCVAARTSVTCTDTRTRASFTLGRDVHTTTNP